MTENVTVEILVPPSAVVTLGNHFPNVASAGIVKLPVIAVVVTVVSRAVMVPPYDVLKSVTVVLPGPGWKLVPPSVNVTRLFRIRMAASSW